MISVRCKQCNSELESHPTKTISCGCPNMTTVKGDTVTAVDLSKVVMITYGKPENKVKSVLSDLDLEFQESRRKRKIRKLDFEIR
jgi:hypothetical protein